jgi:serine/threonine-protein kinase
VVQYLHQTALALDKTHRASIVHRDLKPDNLFLCERDEGPPRIKVLDFGIAKLVAEDSTQANATRSMGTPLYMSPEQFRSGAAVSPATDIFALGMIAYTLLVGVSYWFEESKSGGNVFAFAATAAGGPREPATARAQRQGVTLPPAFDAWFLRATAFSPAERFPAASAAVQALAHALGVPRPGFESMGAIQVPPATPVAAAAYPSFQATPPGMMTPAGAIPMPVGLAAASGSLPTVQLGPMHTPIAAGVTAAPGGNRRTGVVAAAIASVALIAGSAILYAVLAPTRSAKAAPELSAAPAVMQSAAAPQPLAPAPAPPPAPEAVPAASAKVDTAPPPATAAPSAAASATKTMNSSTKRGSARPPAPTSDMDLYSR